MMDPPTTQTAFDLQPASEVLVDLGQMIVQNSAYRGQHWNAITLVSRDEGTSLFGYLYRKDGSWKAETPAGFAVLRRAADLNRAMTANGDPLWKSALFQIKRDKMELKAKFEYEDASRWNVNPGNLAERVEELRPR